MRIAIAGDFVPTGRVETEIQKGKGINLISGLGSLIKDADYSIVNLEAPVSNSTSDKIIKIGPHLSASPESIEVLKQMGFDAVTLANNHIMDFGESGMSTTLKELEKVGLDHVGGGMNIHEATSLLIKKIKEKNIAFINVCEHEFSIADDGQAGASPINPVTNFNKIKEARRIADIVIMIIHGGNEYYQLPNPRMQELYRFFIEAGADAVINHHQHCYSGYEYYKGKPIAYGLGNFIFDEKRGPEHWNEGQIAILDFSDDKAPMLTLEPYVQCLEEPVVRAMTESESKDYSDNINILNKIISDRNLLEEQFKLLIRRKKGAIIGIFSSWPSEYLRAAAARKLLPTLLGERKVASMLDYINCESQRDITLGVLKNMITNKFKQDIH